MNTSAASTETKLTEVICKGDTTAGMSGLVGTWVHPTSPWGAAPWAGLPVHLRPRPPRFQQRGRFCRPPQGPFVGGGLPQAWCGVLGTPTLTQPRDSLPQTPPKLAPRCVSPQQGSLGNDHRPPSHLASQRSRACPATPHRRGLSPQVCAGQRLPLLQLRAQQTGLLPGGHVCTSMGDSASLS